MLFFCFPLLPFCTIPYKLCNKKAQICCLISMETTIFATVLRSGEVSLHIWYRRERVCLFHVLRWVCPDSRYGWRLNALPMLYERCNREIPSFFYSSSIFIIQCAKIIILKSVIQNDIVLRLYIYMILIVLFIIIYPLNTLMNIKY